MPAPDIRLATEADLPVINDIYNAHVASSTCTYAEEPDSLEARRAWLAAHGPTHPVTVAELDGAVAGWGSLSPFHGRCGYRHTVENSVYVAPGAHRRGVGAALLGDLIERARTLGHHAIIALVDSEQVASLELHRKLGFEPAGRLRQVGRKFGRWLDLVYLERLI